MNRGWTTKIFSLINILIVFMGLAGCSGNPHKAPVVDAGPIPTHRIQTHVVAPGETLYSIALRYDLDYKKLASVNKLGAGFRIEPGQVLNLDTRRASRAGRVVAAVPRAVSKKPPSAPDRSKNQTVKPKPSDAAPKVLAAVRWQWPVKGEVLEKFQSAGGLNKGIDIRGKLGEPVLAAATGEVVYAGSGLRGYGKLIIIKHNEQYLSAYAHNRVLMVAEGDRVAAGQKIAEVGFSGTNTAKLHFEIRLDGKPVNPLDYLPNP